MWVPWKKVIDQRKSQSCLFASHRSAHHAGERDGREKWYCCISEIAASLSMHACKQSFLRCVGSNGAHMKLCCFSFNCLLLHVVASKESGIDLVHCVIATLNFKSAKVRLPHDRLSQAP
jgi:hypothetical protein